MVNPNPVFRLALFTARRPALVNGIPVPKGMLVVGWLTPDREHVIWGSEPPPDAKPVLFDPDSFSYVMGDSVG